MEQLVSSQSLSKQQWSSWSQVNRYVNTNGAVGAYLTIDLRPTAPLVFT
jgi:hypothetical protein